MKLSQWVRYRRLLDCFVLKVIDKQICFSHAPCKKVWNPAYSYLWIPESSQFLESGIHCVQSRILDCLGFH